MSKADELFKKLGYEAEDMKDKILEKQIHELKLGTDKHIMTSKLKYDSGEESNMRIEQTPNKLKIDFWNLEVINDN